MLGIIKKEIINKQKLSLCPFITLWSVHTLNTVCNFGPISQKGFRRTRKDTKKNNKDDQGTGGVSV